MGCFSCTEQTAISHGKCWEMDSKTTCIVQKSTITAETQKIEGSNLSKNWFLKIFREHFVYNSPNFCAENITQWKTSFPKFFLFCRITSRFYLAQEISCYQTFFLGKAKKLLWKFKILNSNLSDIISAVPSFFLSSFWVAASKCKEKIFQICVLFTGTCTSPTLP